MKLWSPWHWRGFCGPVVGGCGPGTREAPTQACLGTGALGRRWPLGGSDPSWGGLGNGVSTYDRYLLFLGASAALLKITAVDGRGWGGLGWGREKQAG